jgi:hypothetical protein
MSGLDRYERYRQVGQQLNSEILAAYSDRELILRSAADLGIDFDGMNLEYESESEMSVHFEYAIYEYRRDGKTAAERYFEAERWDTDMERAVLEATLDADTSLFEIETVSESEARLTVADLLNDGREQQLLDVNLSQTATPGTVLFCRPVTYEEFIVTSGVSLPFPGDETERLLSEYDQRVDPTDSRAASRHRFVTFHDLYREYGIHIDYR